VSHEDDVDVLLAVNFLKCLLVDVGSLLLLDSINLSGSGLLLASRGTVASRGRTGRGLA